MKKITLLVLILAAATGYATAQRGFHALSVSTGVSYFNSKYITLELEKQNPKKLNLGFLVQGIFYNKTETKTINFKSDNTYLAAGMYVSLFTNKSRNFSQTVKLGGAIGTDNDNLLWFPFLSLRQCFYISNKIQLITSEGFQYLFDHPYINKPWQPTFQIGLQLQL